MLNFKNLIFTLLTSCLILPTSLLAASFETPKNYHIIIADGQKVKGTFSEENKINLTTGKHQIIVQFKGVFKQGKDKILHTAVDPIVVNIQNVQENDNISFTYPRITNYSQAVDYSDSQKIDLCINDKIANKEEASYFILKSEKGFQLDRDYLAELQDLNLLYLSKENSEDVSAKKDKLNRCKESGFVDCPNTILANANSVNSDNKANLQISNENKKTTVNNQMLEGLKSIYNSADKPTQDAFKEWLKNH